MSGARVTRRGIYAVTWMDTSGLGHARGYGPPGAELERVRRCAHAELRRFLCETQSVGAGWRMRTDVHLIVTADDGSMQVEIMEV